MIIPDNSNTPTKVNCIRNILSRVFKSVKKNFTFQISKIKSSNKVKKKTERKIEKWLFFYCHIIFHKYQCKVKENF